MDQFNQPLISSAKGSRGPLRIPGYSPGVLKLLPLAFQSWHPSWPLQD